MSENQENTNHLDELEEGFSPEDMQISNCNDPGNQSFNNGGFPTSTSGEGSSSGSFAVAPSSDPILPVGDHMICSSSEAARRDNKSPFSVQMVLNQVSKLPFLGDMVLNPQAQITPTLADPSSSFPITSITIGKFEVRYISEGDLMAEFQYAREMISWEVMVGSLKFKMEMRWADIDALRATLHDNEPAILEIELNRQPTFYQEITHPTMHSIWRPTFDFTMGQALDFWTHRIRCAPGVLYGHYVNLLQLDKRLLELSQTTFRSQQPPYLDPGFDPGLIPRFSGLNLDEYGSSMPDMGQSYAVSYPNPELLGVYHPSGDIGAGNYSHVTGMQQQREDNGAGNYPYATGMQQQLQDTAFWNQGPSNPIGIGHVQDQLDLTVYPPSENNRVGNYFYDTGMQQQQQHGDNGAANYLYDTGMQQQNAAFWNQGLSNPIGSTGHVHDPVDLTVDDPSENNGAGNYLYDTGMQQQQQQLGDSGAGNYSYATGMQHQQQTAAWNHEGIYTPIGNIHVQGPFDLTSQTQGNQAFDSQNIHCGLRHLAINNDLLGDTQMPYTIEGHPQAITDATTSLHFGELMDFTPILNNANHSGLDYYQVAGTSAHQVFPPNNPYSGPDGNWMDIPHQAWNHGAVQQPAEIDDIPPMFDLPCDSASVDSNNPTLNPDQEFGSLD